MTFKNRTREQLNERSIRNNELTQWWWLICFSSVLWGRCARVLICTVGLHSASDQIRRLEAASSVCLCLKPLLVHKPFPRAHGGNLQTSAFSIRSGLWGWFRGARGTVKTFKRQARENNSSSALVCRQTSSSSAQTFPKSAKKLNRISVCSVCWECLAVWSFFCPK